MRITDRFLKGAFCNAVDDFRGLKTPETYCHPNDKVTTKQQHCFAKGSNWMVFTASKQGGRQVSA